MNACGIQQRRKKLLSFKPVYLIVPDSTLIPVGELENRLDEVPRDREIVVVCRSGNRSRTGRDILLKAGYPQVTSVTGGLKQWQAAGYPTVSGP